MNKSATATFLALAAASLLASPALAGEAPVCKDLITPAMVEAACGAKMTMRRSDEKPKRCTAKLNNVDMMNGNIVYFTAYTYPDEAKAAREHERWKKASQNNAAPEKAAKDKADGMPFTEALTEVPGIGAAAYERRIFNPATEKSRIILDILAGNQRIELNSDMWLAGNSLPCDSGQLQNLAREAVTKLGH